VEELGMSDQEKDLQGLISELQEISSELTVKQYKQKSLETIKELIVILIQQYKQSLSTKQQRGVINYTEQKYMHLSKILLDIIPTTSLHYNETKEEIKK
jgi:hypothetical protein